MDSTTNPNPASLTDARAELVEIELQLEDLRERLPHEGAEPLLDLRRRLAMICDDLDAAITIIDAGPNR